MSNNLPIALTTLGMYFNHYFSLKMFHPYEHYAACCVPLNFGGKWALDSREELIRIEQSTISYHELLFTKSYSA